MQEYDKKVFFVLLTATFLLFIFGLGSASLLDPFETDYQDIAKKMLHTGNFLFVPQIGDNNFSLPPIYFWLLTGVKYFENLPPYFLRGFAAVFAALTAFFLYPFGAKIFEERAGFWSCIILSTSFLAVLAGKLAFNTAGATFFLTLFGLSYLNGQYWRMYLFIILSGMFVGFPGIVLPFLLIFLHAIFWGKISRFWHCHFFLGLIFVIMIFIPWVYLGHLVYGQEFLVKFFSLQSLSPFMKNVQLENSIYYYLPVLLISLVPWSGFLFGAFHESICNSKIRELENFIFLYLWIILGLFFLTIYPLRFAVMLWYIMPPFALILGWNGCQMEKGFNNFASFDKYILGTVLTFLMSVGIWLMLGRIYPELNFSACVMAFMTMVLLVAILVSILYFRDVQLYLILHGVTGLLNSICFTLYFFPVFATKINLHEQILNLIK